MGTWARFGTVAVFGMVVVLVLAMLPGVAAANGDPVGGCPSGTEADGPDPEASGWDIIPVDFLSYPEDVGNTFDQNGDGYVCRRFVYGFRLAPIRDDCCGFLAVKDNTNPVNEDTIP